MFIKIILTILFLCVTVGVGIYSRKQAKSVDGFVLGGRTVGGWLTAFAFGTSYFSAVVFVGYAGQFGWKYGLSASWICCYRFIDGLADIRTQDKTDDTAHTKSYNA